MTNQEFIDRVQALRPTLYRVCCVQLSIPADREDAVQEAVFRAWRSRDTLRDERHFSAWFIRVLLNVCHDLQRQQRRTVPVDPPPEPPDAGDERTGALREALRTLDERQRLCVLLHHIEGYSVRETARMLGVSESAVKLRLVRGRRRLRELLSEEVFGQ